MKAYTKETGWATVIRDDKKHLGFWLCVPRYTFYLARYQDILAIEGDRKEMHQCKKNRTVQK
jgi:hypothetical protein